MDKFIAGLPIKNRDFPLCKHLPEGNHHHWALDASSQESEVRTSSPQLRKTPVEKVGLTPAMTVVN